MSSLEIPVVQGEADLPPEDHFAGLVLKVAPRCNLACEGCYEYLEGNDAWRDLPRMMPLSVVKKAGERLGEYAGAHKLRDTFIAFHGGEPLLLGPEGLAERAEQLRGILPHVRFSIQTNGLLLDKDVLDVLTSYNFRVGLSLDGNQTANDRYRLDHAGHSSYEGVMKAIHRLQKSRLQWGLLAVIDIRNDPLETYHSLIEHRPPLGIDFLLPHGNWSSRPRDRDDSDNTPYADWLLPIWYEYIESLHPTPPIRKFQSILNMLQGGPPLSESLGNPSPKRVFIRADGAYEDVDTLLSAFPGAPALHMNVFDNSLDEVAKTEQMKRRRIGQAALSRTCQQCPVVKICGGGYWPHRYSRESGFTNPSVYCADLKYLIGSMFTSLQSFIEAPPVTE